MEMSPIARAALALRRPYLGVPRLSLTAKTPIPIPRCVTEPWGTSADLVHKEYGKYLPHARLASVKNDAIIRQRYALMSRIIAGMSYAVIIPEARYKERSWGTKYQVRFSIKAQRPVIILKPSED